ncbi:hypothetical protein Dimus_027371 [Dionaea muscipula]
MLDFSLMRGHALRKFFQGVVSYQIYSKIVKGQPQGRSERRQGSVHWAEVRQFQNSLSFSSSKLGPLSSSEQVSVSRSSLHQLLPSATKLTSFQPRPRPRPQPQPQPQLATAKYLPPLAGRRNRFSPGSESESRM